METILQQEAEPTKLNISVRPLYENDLERADYIMRLAFGTFIGLPEPTTFMGDADMVRTRWKANSFAAFGADVDGQLMGSNFASNWGSVGFFGPLTIHPDLWDRGVGKHLMNPVLECFENWGTKHAGLFTFAHSQKHVGLYQKFGFFPRFLTMIMSKKVDQAKGELDWTTFSQLAKDEQENMLLVCRQLTDSVYEGLDVRLEVQSVENQKLGETLLLWNDGKLIGLAVCHCGPGTEAGSGACFVKFGVVDSGSTAERNFELLLKACEEMAAQKGMERIVAGVNTAREEAYKKMLEYGYRTDLQGVVMERTNEQGYHRPEVYLIDDWR